MYLIGIEYEFVRCTDVESCYWHVRITSFAMILYMVKYLRETFTVGIKNDCSWQIFVVAASFNNKCLWLVNYSSQNICGRVKNHENHKTDLL